MNATAETGSVAELVGHLHEQGRVITSDVMGLMLNVIVVFRRQNVKAYMVPVIVLQMMLVVVYGWRIRLALTMLRVNTPMALRHPFGSHKSA